MNNLKRRQTYLSLDIGSQHTRSWLFSNQSSLFELIGHTETQTTIAGGSDLLTGVWRACENLERLTGYHLLDYQGKLMVGQINQEETVAKVGISTSAGPRIRTVLVGLSQASTIKQLKKLSSLFYTEIIDAISLDNCKNTTQQLERLMTSNPELIIIAGGEEQGAFRPLIGMIENIRMVYHELPQITKPQIVYAGNSTLHQFLVKTLEAGSDLHLSPNIQPVVGQVNIAAAWNAMLAAYERIQLNRLRGLSELKRLTNSTIVPTAFSIGRTLRYLDEITKKSKGVVAIDVGAGSTMLLASRADQFISILNRTAVDLDVGEKICQWSSFPLDIESASTYMHNKLLHPGFMPASVEDLAIEHAWTRVRLIDTLSKAADLYSEVDYQSTSGLRSTFEPVILSGESLLNVPEKSQAFLMAIDSLQPTGITTIVEDTHLILSALGTQVNNEPLLPVQVLDSNIFNNLGTVISAESPEKSGEVIMNIEIAHEDGSRETHLLKKGHLNRFELKPGKKAKIYLAPEPQTDIGMGRRGLGGWVTVVGGEVGVIVDTRGRPIELPTTTEKRAETIRNWIWEMVG